MTVTAEYNTKDQNWQEESTTYWFTLAGQDYGTKKEFDGDEYGIVDQNGVISVVDGDGYPVDTDDHLARVVRNACVITEAMIND